MAKGQIINQHGQVMWRTTIMLPRQIIEAVKMEAVRRHVTASELLREALAEGLPYVAAAEPHRPKRRVL